MLMGELKKPLVAFVGTVFSYSHFCNKVFATKLTNFWNYNFTTHSTQCYRSVLDRGVWCKISLQSFIFCCPIYIFYLGNKSETHI